MALDIDERHLLRLGHGEEELDTDKDFSRYGRVNFILSLRLELLKEVERLQVRRGGWSWNGKWVEPEWDQYGKVEPEWETG